MLHFGSHTASVLVFHIRCSLGGPFEAKRVQDRDPRLSIADCRCCMLDCRTVGTWHLSTRFELMDGRVATGITLTALEACKYPFQMPDFFHITKKITCHVSSFGEDFLDRSVSRASSFDNDNPFETDKTEVDDRKPLPERRSDDSQASTERPLTPLLQIPKRSTSRGWGEQWTHLAGERSSGSEKNIEKQSEEKVLSHSDSGISLSNDSSSGYISSSESEHVSGSRRSGYRSSSNRSSHAAAVPRVLVTRRAPRPRIVTPSSSISNYSRRSPLSTMR